MNIEPTNTFARSAKHARVKPNSPDSSLLFMKIDQQLALDLWEFNVQVTPFAISPRTEREISIYGKDCEPVSIFANRFEIKMWPGSHHVLLCTYSGTDLNGI